MASLFISDNDRDPAGNILVQPRTLADLLPPSPAGDAAPAAPPRQWNMSQRMYFALALSGAIILVALFALFGAPAAPAPLAATPPLTTPAPAPSTAPSPEPTTAPIPVLAWSVDAFDAARHYVGPLVAGRPYTVRGAADATWLEIDAPAHDGAPASGAVWIRAVDLIAQPTAYGPTPVPTAEPAPVYVAPPPAAEIDVLSPSYQATDQAILQQMHPATPTPNMAATIRAQIAATHVSICATAAALGVPGGVGGACGAP